MRTRFLLFSAVAYPACISGLLSAAPACSELPFEVFAEGFKFPEGPAFDSKGNLYVVNYQAIGDIAVISPEGKAEVFIDLNPAGEANGMAFSPDGRIIACDDRGRRIISIDLATKKVTPVVDNYDGQSFGRPNDIFLCTDGDIYFTDPNREEETTGGRVFVYSQKEKKLYKLLDGLAFPNGLTLAPDRRTLYVGSTVRRNVTAYPLSDNGHTAGQGREVFLMSGGNGPDGIEADQAGNLFITHYGGGRIYYVSPAGKLLGCATGFGANLTNVEVHGGWVYLTEAERGQVLRIKKELFTNK